MIEMSTVAWLRRAAVIGVIGGVVLVYLALVGLVEAFSERDVITNVLTLGQRDAGRGHLHRRLPRWQSRRVASRNRPCACGWPAASWPAPSPGRRWAC